MSGCPYKFPLYKKYTRESLSKAEKFGIEVHKMMERGLPNPPEITDAYEIAYKLQTMTNNLGYKIIDREVTHIAPLTEGIQVFGIIDAVAELDGEPILIDYKTGARKWADVKTIHGELITPKSVGYQGPVYLTRPYEDKYFGGEWAGELHYLLAPNNGVTQVYKYHQNDTDDQNLIRTAKIIKDAADKGWFPKNRGWLCGSCSYKHACYETPNWKKYHKVKEVHSR
jgi:CRISPR/Cas system-associated exonuclease Cas4 (RecB family)